MDGSQDFSILTNNNYLPAVSQYNGVVPKSAGCNFTSTFTQSAPAFQAPVMSHGVVGGVQPILQPPVITSLMQQTMGHSYSPPIFTNPVYHQQNFTFSFPTQATGVVMSSSQNFVSQPWAGVIGNMPQVTAPGVGINWQHTIPTQIPWANTANTFPTPGVSSFTASSECDLNSPQPSCSEMARRHKRHLQERNSSLCPPNKVRLTEDKIAAEMQDLKISNGIPYNRPVPSPVHTNIQDPVIDTDSFKLNVQKNCIFPQWQSFSNRFSVDEDAEAVKKKKTISARPKLHLLADLKSLLPSNLILPRKILEEIRKPKMEIVLWQPPEIFKAMPHTEETKGSSQSQQPQTIISGVYPDIPTPVPEPSVLKCFSSEDNMETEMCDNLDIEMIL
ncbi:hypothetical protein CHS0354_024399 [Potamilus streckersoni]|uniref:Uncharacterized protein n=1 Tax=Potamilus streckersoni TaxID=2493646 RepID=A0AAE0W3F8_9BIVA|nr:hypothetical protein CHS0354_024399 [Potamilus streckersoni]